VPRDQLGKGAEEIGLPLEEHVINVIEVLKTARGELGL
jgi:predicted hydrolase (HD superfamily)